MVKLDARGREVWRNERGTQGLEIAYGLVRAPTGGVVAAGMQTGVGHDVLVLALSARGQPGWQYAPQEVGNQVCYGLAGDRHGNLYLAGEAAGRWEVGSLDRAGRARWSRQGPAGAARAIATRDGEVLAVGNDTAGWRVIALDTDGAPRWELDGARAPRSAASGVAIGRDGSAYVVGSWFDDARRLRVVKLRGKDVLWTYLDGTNVPIPRAMTVLRDETVVKESDTPP